MSIDDIREYCLAKAAVEETLPFGPDTLVFKVAGKMFLLTALDALEPSFNAKCDPEMVEELRDKYSCVLPGYHMNKKHWNTIMIDGSVSNKQLKTWIDDSYNLVVAGLSKKTREAFKL